MTYQKDILKGLLKVRDIIKHIRRKNSIDPQERNSIGSQLSHEHILTLKLES